MIYSIKNVIAAAKNRKPGYLEAVMKMAKQDGEYIELTDEQVESLKKYHFSRGLGDTIAKVTEDAGETRNVPRRRKVCDQCSDYWRCRDICKVTTKILRTMPKCPRGRW